MSLTDEFYAILREIQDEQFLRGEVGQCKHNTLLYPRSHGGCIADCGECFEEALKQFLWVGVRGGRFKKALRRSHA